MPGVAPKLQQSLLTGIEKVYALFESMSRSLIAYRFVEGQFTEQDEEDDFINIDKFKFVGRIAVDEPYSPAYIALQGQVKAIQKLYSSFKKDSRDLSYIINILDRLHLYLKDFINTLNDEFSPGFEPRAIVLRNYLIVLAQQLNLMIQDCFLAIDAEKKITSDALQRSCGLYRTSTFLYPGDADEAKGEQKAELGQMLGESNDGYVFSPDGLYYIYRQKDSILKKRLPKNQSNFAEWKEYTWEKFKAALGLNSPLSLLEEKGNHCIHKNLPSQHLQLIRSVTGHDRNAIKYDTVDVSVAKLAKKHNDWIQGQGYEFHHPDQHSPYARFFEKKEEKTEKPEKMPQEQYLQFKQHIFEAQIDKRMGELQSQINKSWFLFTNTKMKKMALWEKMRETLIGYDFALKSAPLPREPNRFYINANPAGLEYEVLDNNGHLEIDLIPWDKLPGVPRTNADIVAAGNKHLLQIVKAASKPGQSRLSNLTMQEAFEKLKRKVKNASLLREGESGKLFDTLSLVTTKPEDRINLLDAEVERQRLKCERAQKSWFCSDMRVSMLNSRWSVVKKFKEEFSVSGCRLQDALDSMQIRDPAAYQSLMDCELKLLRRLQTLESYLPDVAMEKKLINPDAVQMLLSVDPKTRLQESKYSPR